MKVDDSTFKMVFEQPNGLLLKNLAMLGGGTFIKPAHYAKQFHTKYNKEAVDKMVADQHLADWAALFNQKVGTSPNVGDARWFNPELPTIFPWMVTIRHRAGHAGDRHPQPLLLEGGPAGQPAALPGSKLTTRWSKADDRDRSLKALNGEIEMEDRHFTTPTTSRSRRQPAEGAVPLLHRDAGQHEHLHRAVQLQPQRPGAADRSSRTMDFRIGLSLRD